MADVAEVGLRPARAHAEAAMLLRRLIACDTSNPPGREAEAATILESFLEPVGIECERVAKDPERPNLIARLAGTGEGQSLAFLGHLDVVQATPSDWSVPPFAAVESQGAIWGRGAVDMKCQVAAAASALRELARNGFEPHGDVMLILTADEEVGDAEVGAPFLVEARPDLAPDFVVGEGAGERYVTPQGPLYLLDHGVKESASATVTVRGRPGDASLRTSGRNAAVELARLLLQLERFEAPLRAPPELRPLLTHVAPDALNDADRVARARAADEALGMIVDALVGNVVRPTVVQADGPENVIPEQASATLYCATVPGCTKGELEAEIRAALGEGAYELSVTEPEGGSTSPLHTPLHRAIESFLARNDPEATLVPALGYGYSDCHMLREAYGSVAYGFIPFRHADPLTNLTTKHGPDERVLLADVAFQVDAALHVARAIGAG